MRRTNLLLTGAVVAALLATGAAAQNRDRNAYFGDLHVHTKLSFDAYIFNVRATPDDAYRYAKGESIHHASGYDVRLTDAPLDFLAVTDHSEYLGVIPAMHDPQAPLSKVPYAADLFSTEREKINAAFQRIADQPAHRAVPARAQGSRTPRAPRGARSSNPPIVTTCPASSRPSAATSSPPRRTARICIAT